MSDFYDFNSSNHDCENNFTFPDVPVEPTDRTGRKARKNRRSRRNHPLAKKVGTLTLSALLFGSVSAGAFQAVNTLSGYTESRLAASSTSDSESSGHLLKATTISNEQTTNPSASMDVSSIVKSAMPCTVCVFMNLYKQALKKSCAIADVILQFSYTNSVHLENLICCNCAFSGNQNLPFYTWYHDVGLSWWF